MCILLDEMAIFVLVEECCSCWCCDSDDDDMTLALQEMNSHRDDPLASYKEEADEGEEENITHTGPYHLAKRHSGRDGETCFLPANFDPKEDYYHMYMKLGDIHYNPIKESNQSITSITDDTSEHHPIGTFEGVSILSLENCESMVTESDHLFASSCGGDLTPREVVSGLNRYIHAIKFERDETRRREWIRRYEVHKFDFDTDNRDDAEKAYFARTDASNTEHPLKLRLFSYQVAIKYTNDMREKEKRWEEYIAFCNSIKRKAQ